LDAQKVNTPPLGSPSEAILAVSRLLSLAVEPDGADEVHAALVREAKSLFRVKAAVLVAVREREGNVVALAGDCPPERLDEPIPVESFPCLAELVERRLPVNRVIDEEQINVLRDLLLGGVEATSALLLGLRSGAVADHVLVLADDRERAFVGEESAVATAFANAAGAALGQLRRAEERERETTRHAALTRAAKTLNESLELEALLARICREAATILGADIAAVYRAEPGGDLRVAAVHGLPPEVVGYHLPLGLGLAGKVARANRAMLTNDYQRVADLPPDSPFGDVRSSLAVPMRWGDRLRAVIGLGYRRPYRVDADDLAMLETFAEMAAVACHNASAHAGLLHAARTDGLTGCLNHAALQEALAREIGRAERRATSTLSLVMIDLDGFKQVNDRHGHLVGDEVLRKAGAALRSVTRPYDVAARYGGDEFALVAVEAEEQEAAEIGARAVTHLTDAMQSLGYEGLQGATAGVAQWEPDMSASELVARADRALMLAKQEDRRGTVQVFSELPALLHPGRRFTRRMGSDPLPADHDPAWPGAGSEDRLRKRTRQLALANSLGARLAAMTDVEQIWDAAVDELHRAFGYFCVAIIRVREDGQVESIAGRGTPFVRLGAQRWLQPGDAGFIGRALRERRAIVSNDVLAEPDYVVTTETQETRAELCVPLFVGGDLWGAINVEENRPGAFDEDDVRLVETVADQIGSAMRSAMLYEQLERAYIGTAEALAAALEAKDDYAADHARMIVTHAEAVGRRLGMTDDDLRDLRFGAVFHDIGKLAVPEPILSKRGRLTDEERVEIERHSVVGEQILAPVEFLNGVRPLVRHGHERWDGGGYPDGLAADSIPLGSRIILACDAVHAMTSDRPYRSAMTDAEAIDELRRCSGTQFDPHVVDALVEVLEEERHASNGHGS
jgi:diguanylate cyclase (GGDEF)-like protein